MNLSLILPAVAAAAINLAAADLPKPFTPAHMEDIACVASLGIIAGGQSDDSVGNDDIPDLRQLGRIWAGIVGDRVVFETGQPQDIVAFAIQAAVQAERAHVTEQADAREARIAKCLSRMRADLAADGVRREE